MKFFLFPILIVSILVLFGCSSNALIRSKQAYPEQGESKGVDIAKENLDSLLHVYKTKASEGDANAMYFLGFLYDPIQQMLRSKLPKDAQPGIALEWYTQAALKGNQEAINRVASFYEQGIEMPKDPEKANYWYGQGYQKTPNAFVLKMHYIHKIGLGCPIDLSKAKFYLRQAQEAAKQDGELAYDLGIAYLNGADGLPIKQALGKKWLKKAYDLGFMFAELELKLQRLK